MNQLAGTASSSPQSTWKATSGSDHRPIISGLAPTTTIAIGPDTDDHSRQTRSEVGLRLPVDSICELSTHQYRRHFQLRSRIYAKQLSDRGRAERQCDRIDAPGNRCIRSGGLSCPALLPVEYYAPWIQDDIKVDSQADDQSRLALGHHATGYREVRSNQQRTSSADQVNPISSRIDQSLFPGYKVIRVESASPELNGLSRSPISTPTGITFSRVLALHFN